MERSVCQNDITDGRVVMQKKICENGDTQIFFGLYYGKSCTIKKIRIDEIVGIKSKVLREISFLKKIQHENIVKLYSVCYDDSNIYIILESGDENILELCHRDLKPNILTDVINGLRHIESNGYIHGDASFKNILRFKNVFKLIDFGSVTKTYRTSAVKLPTQYITPPEMINKSDIYPNKIDAWAVGCLAYYVSTGNMIMRGCDIFYNDKKINQLLNKNPLERNSVSEYYVKHIKKQNTLKLIEYSTKRILLSDCEIFCNPVINSNSFRRGQQRCNLIQIYLHLNISNCVPVENIFIALKLMNLVSIKSADEYMIVGLILYYLTTKIVSNKEVNSVDIMSYINWMVSKELKIRSLRDFNKRVIALLFELNWNIDIDTQISHIQTLNDSNKTKYLEVCLTLLCCPEYDVFSYDFLHKVVLAILECCIESTTKHVIETDNHHLLLSVATKILTSLKDMKLNNTSTINEVLMAYFKSTNNYDYLEWIDRVDLKRICGLGSVVKMKIC